MQLLFERFLRDETAATSIEYSVIAAGVAVVIVGTVGSLGSSVKDSYVRVQTAFK